MPCRARVFKLTAPGSLLVISHDSKRTRRRGGHIMTWRASGAESTTARQIVDRWWMVAAIALVGAIGGYWLPQLDPPVYQSASTFVIATEDSIEDSGDVAAALGVLRNRQITATFAVILQSETLLDRAAREIGSAGSDFESTGVVLPESYCGLLTG